MTWLGRALAWLTWRPVACLAAEGDLEAARDLARAPDARGHLRSLLQRAQLPPAVRDAYGFRWTPRAQRVANAWLDALGIVRRILPAPVLALPARISLRRLRRRSRYAGTEPRGRG